ncbi:MAG TPA: hypothetical protein VFY78_11195 [Gammaproteobacteria bacterium]|nr:hypothetical protein [Gammaproteobacteria bacterium]
MAVMTGIVDVVRGVFIEARANCPNVRWWPVQNIFILEQFEQATFVAD